MEQIDRDKTIEELERCVKGEHHACIKCDYGPWDNQPVLVCRPLIEKALKLLKAEKGAAHE